jgi:hypothetical protein
MQHIICNPRVQKSCFAEYLTDGIYLNSHGELQYVLDNSKQVIYTRTVFLKSESTACFIEAFNLTKDLFKIFLQKFTKYSIAIFTVYWFFIQEENKVIVNIFVKSEDEAVNNFLRYSKIL